MMNTLMSRLSVRAAIYAIVPAKLGMLWGFPGVAKLSAGGVPGWFAEQFGGTFLASLPGLAASFYSIGILETLAALAAVGSLLRGEFLRDGRPSLLLTSIVLSLVLFVQLNFGKQLLADYDGTHDLFMYFAGMLVILSVVRSLETRQSVTPPPAM